MVSKLERVGSIWDHVVNVCKTQFSKHLMVTGVSATGLKLFRVDAFVFFRDWYDDGGFENMWDYCLC